MTTRLEEELTHALAGAADHAPKPNESFLDGVRRRQRARRHSRIAGVAGCVAVLAVVAGVAFTKVSVRSSDEQLPFASSAWSGTVPDFDRAASFDKVWPDAVKRLPATLPDGAAYQVYALLGADRYLVRIESNEGKRTDAWSPWVFNARTGEATYLGSEASSNGSSTGDWTTAVGDYALWFGTTRQQDGKGLDGTVWRARLDGTDEPALIATVRDHGMTPPLIGVVGDSIYWDQDGDGIYRLPVTGGTPQRVPDSVGYRLFRLSPWADTGGHFPGWQEPDRQGVLWNLETGERLRWRASEKAPAATCGPLLCTGFGESGRHFVQRPDGSGYQELPYPEDGFHASSALDGRFSVGTVQTSQGLMWYAWDLITGKAGVFSAEPPGGDRPDAPEAVYRGYEDAVLQWQLDQEWIYVLDLAAIR